MEIISYTGLVIGTTVSIDSQKDEQHQGLPAPLYGITFLPSFFALSLLLLFASSSYPSLP